MNDSPAGTIVSTAVAPEAYSGYHFAYWTLDGTRMGDASGGAANPIAFHLYSSADAVALYLPTAEDSDNDGLPDWWELRYFGNLLQNASADPDSDGLSNAMEYTTGQHPLLGNEYIAGGVSRRRSATATIIENTASYALLQESSVPGGVFSQTRVVKKGEPVTLTNPPAGHAGYYFTGWLRDGIRFDPPTDFPPISVTLTRDSSFMARYVLGTSDKDDDNVPDWRELLTFESLQYNLSSDPDNDGLPWSEEMARNFSTLAADELIVGGLSRRRSDTVYVNTTGRLPFTTISDPATILNERQNLPAGTLVTVPDRSGQSFANYRFAWWELNGTRLQDASGTALPAFSFTLNTPTELVGHYVDPLVDVDGDGIKDWNEFIYYGSINPGASDDTDGDGFTYAEELARGQSPRVPDSLEGGGISRRRSATAYLDTTGRLSYRVVSDPASILNELEYYPAGTRITVPDRSGHTVANYKFAWWDLDGIRQQDASGTALTGFNFVLNHSSIVAGHYIDPSVDADGDGIKDWSEVTYYGTTANSVNSDTDGDGFTFAEEIQRSQSPRVTDTLVSGGISRRRSAMKYVEPIFGATIPEIGAITVNNIGTTDARLSAWLNPMSAATTAYFEYGTSAAYGTQISGNAVANGFQALPITAWLQVLQPDTVYHCRVVATNIIGTSTSNDFNFRTLPSLTAYGAWSRTYGVGRPLDDDDFDGLVNLLEFATGSDPFSSNSPPTRILSNGDDLEFLYDRLKYAVNAGIAFTVEWSDTLSPNDWSVQGIVQSIEHDDGTMQQIKAIVPMGISRGRFVRLRVTNP